MRRMAWMMAGWLVTAAPGAMAAAQETPPATPQEDEGAAPGAPGGGEMEDVEEVVITGAPLRGSVPGDVKPELILTPADIRAYGVGSIADLLTELEPQTRSGRGGPPVLLLSGRRISGFGEIRDIPPEAIERVDILPEEAALKLGYRADQRVVNFVLRPRFRSITAEADATFATAGGRSGQDIELTYLRLNRDGRLNVDVEYERDNWLLESERDVISATSGSLFDPVGNIAGLLPGGEIDPALSALAGTTVTVAGAPASAATAAPTLNGFLAAANNPNMADVGDARTLLPESEKISLNGVLARNIGSVGATVTARFEQTDTDALLGLPSASLTLPAGNPFSPFAADTRLLRYYDQFSPLARDSRNQSLEAGFSLNGDLSRWRWSLTGNWTRNESRTVTQTGVDATLIQARLEAGDPDLNPFGTLPAGFAVRAPDQAKSVSNVGSIDALIAGPLAELPAGDISTSLRLSGRTSDLESDFVRSGIPGSLSTGRDIASFQSNIDLPIASRTRGFISGIGNLSLNANLEVEEVSDFGTLTKFGYGANWSPVNEVRLSANFTEEEGAPSAQQLGNPVLTTPNVRVFDFVRGETVDISQIDGGNPNLAADDRSRMKLGLYVRPFGDRDLVLNVDYNRTVIRNPIAAFPTVTAEIEAAFPGRFLRDGSGRLIQIDNRPVNFERSERQDLRWGVNFSKSISSPLARQAMEQMRAARAQRQAERQQSAPEQSAEGSPPPGEGERRARPDGPRAEAGPGRGPGGRGGGFGGRGGGGGGGRLQLGVYHTIALKDEITIRQGLPVLDLLDGSATGSRGGSPRHQVEVRAGVVRDGIGLRLNADWNSATTVRGGANSAETLRFDDFTKVNLRLFANLGPQFKFVRDNRWLTGTRVVLSVDNLFDSRLRVTDQTGATPLGYQPDLTDPLGRTVRISIRKLFF